MPSLLPIDLANPVVRSHPLNRALTTWWLCLPGLMGGSLQHDLCALPGGARQSNHGTLLNMDPRSSASGHHGTNRRGGLGQLTLDGSNDVVRAGPLARGLGTANSPLTLSFWGKLTSPDANPRVAVMLSDADGSSSNAVALGMGSSTLRASKAGGTLLADTAVTPTAHVWFHLGYTWDGTTNSIYYNGVLLGSGATTHQTGALSYIWWGNYGSAVSQDWPGALDDLRIAARCFAADEMRQLYLQSAQGYPAMLRRIGPQWRGAALATDHHLTLALVAEDATLAMAAHTEAHLTLALVAEDATLAMALSTSVSMTLALIAENATLSMAMHQPALGASLTWLAAAAHAATLAEETGAYGPVILVDFPDFTRTFSTHPPLFGAEEPRLTRLADGGVGAVSRDLDEIDGGARLVGSSVALASDAGFIETFANGPLLNTPAHIRLGFEGLTEAQFLRIWTGVLDRYQFTHQRLEFALIDSGVRDNVDLNVPISAELFPNAPSESRGLNVPIFIGVHTRAPVIQVSGMEATGVLSFAMDGASTTVALLEDSASFPTAATVTVGAESLSYTGRTLINVLGVTYVELSGLTRGAPVAHSIGAVVTLTALNPSYLTGFGVERVNAVRVNGVPQAAEDVSVALLQIRGHGVPLITLLVVPEPEDVITADFNAISPLLGMMLPAVPDPPSADNKLINGDFETGASGWTAAGGGVLTVSDGATPEVIVGPELVENGGFETGTFAQWYTGTAGAPGTTDPSPHSGTYRAGVSALTSVPLWSIVQGVPVIPSYELVYSFWYQNHPDAGPFSEYSAAIIQLGTPTTYLDSGEASAYAYLAPAFSLGVWAEVTGTLVPAPDRYSVVIRLGSLTQLIGPDIYPSFYDDISMHQRFSIAIAPQAGTGRAELRGAAGAYGDAWATCETVVGQRYRCTVRYVNVFNPLAPPGDRSEAQTEITTEGSPTSLVLLPLPTVQNADDPATWQTATGTFTATGTTSRLTLRSRYTVTPLSSYFDSLTIEPVFEIEDGSESSPGDYDNSGTNPVDAILYMLGLFYPEATYDAQAFATARAQLDAMRFRGLLTNPGDSGTLLQRMGAQCKSLVQHNPMGEYTITVLDGARPTAAVFTTANIVLESFARASVPVDSLFTSFYVYFNTLVGGSTSPGDYAGVVYCTPTGTTVPDGAALVALCLEARTFYGRDHRNDYYADFVKDIDTAHQLLAWRVSRYAIRQDSLTWRAWLDAVPLQLGQVVSVVHPVLANGAAVQLAELTNWHYQPGDQHMTLTARTLGATLDAGLTQPGAPVAYPDVGTAELNTPVVLEILANDVPGLGGVLNPFTIDLDPSMGGRQTTYTDTGKGVFVVDSYGHVTVTPVTDYVGTMAASYTVADQFGSVSNSTTITVGMAGHVIIALIAEDATLAMEMHTEGGEEELAQACNFVFGNDIDDPSVDGGNDTGIHIINAFCYFPEVDTVMACSGDPSMVGGTGAVPGPGFNDVYTSSRLGNSVMNPYTSFLGTIDVTSGGHGVCAMTNMLAYDGLLYVAVTTSLDSDQAVNGPPAIFTVDNITDLDEDTYYDTWVEAQEFATTFSRAGAMGQHNGNLYVALEPKLAGTNALAIWQFDGASWSLQHSFGTSFSRLRAFFGVGSFLYAGVDGQLWFATAGVWAHAQTFTGAVDSLSFKDGLIYVNVRNGSNREIWRGLSDDNIFTLFHTFSGETGTLVGPMGTGMPHPDAVEGYLYVPVHEADGTKVYRWDGTEWTMDHDYGTDFLGVSTMLLTGQVLSLALPRRLHTSDPGGGNVPGCEIWGVNCYYPPTWDLIYDVAVVDFTSLMTDEVLPFPPDATWDVTTLVLDDLVFPELDLTIEVGIDGVITGERTDTSYGGPYTTTYRCDDSLGRHWAGTFSITFFTG